MPASVAGLAAAAAGAGIHPVRDQDSSVRWRRRAGRARQHQPRRRPRSDKARLRPDRPPQCGVGHVGPIPDVRDPDCWNHGVMPSDTSPAARALLALELIQASPGITADRLAGKLGVSERAARRYAGILREAGIPVESVRGPYGGFHIGRGLRLPPLMFTSTEALGLVMAVLDGHHHAGDPADPVGSAL